MFSIDQDLWNQVAPLAKTPLWRRLFSLPREKVLSELDKVSQRLGAEPAVAVAWLQVAPLLQEQEAISQFSRQNPEWAGTIPEVLDAGEATLLAAREYDLSVSQVRTLYDMLIRSPQIE